MEKPAERMTAMKGGPVQEAAYDVVVMGGGPGGSAVSTVLASAGLRVLVLEKEYFPRFHIGESLLPAGWDLWDRLGVTKQIEEEGFAIKQGIDFGMFGAPKDVVLLTREFPEFFQRPYTFHVERARFDQILLNNARAKGVDAREGWTVQDVIFEGSKATGILALSDKGESWRFNAKVVVDATGRNCLLSRKLGWRKLDPTLNKVAHFTHFKGAWRRDARELVPPDEVLPESTTTDIHTIEGGWIWYIPLSNDIVSVGTVLDARYAPDIKGPQERFEYALQTSPKVVEWLKGSTQTMEMHTISNISYLNDEFVGDGFALVGDASMFVDPIFSAGVTIAIRSGIYAAEAILDGFKHNDFSAARLKPYENRIRLPMKNIFKMIYNWYSILGKKDPNNLISRARQIPMLRERLIVLFSGGYERVDMESIVKASETGAVVETA